MRVMLYALGGGLGHATRARALAHSFSGDRVCLLLPGRLRGWARDQGLEARHADGPEGLGDWVQQQLDEVRPELLVVDVFPRGIMGELPDCRLPPRWLVARLCRAGYYEAMPDWLAGFERILWVEDCAPPACLEGCIKKGPLVHQEVPLERNQARTQFGFAERPGLLYLRARGMPPPPALTRFTVFCADHETPPLYPLAAWLPGADLVVSAAGYNCFYQLRGRLPVLWWPQKRLYDEQEHRLARCPLPGWNRTVRSREDLLAALDSFRQDRL